MESNCKNHVDKTIIIMYIYICIFRPSLVVTFCLSFWLKPNHARHLLRYIYMYTYIYIYNDLLRYNWFNGYIYIYIETIVCCYFQSCVDSNHERHLKRCVPVCLICVYIYITQLRAPWETTWETCLDIRRWVFNSLVTQELEKSSHMTDIQSNSVHTDATKSVLIKWLHGYGFSCSFMRTVSWDIFSRPWSTRSSSI